MTDTARERAEQVIAQCPHLIRAQRDGGCVDCIAAALRERDGGQDAMTDAARAFSYERIIGTDGVINFRVSDADDDRIATCYLEENARFIVDSLNAFRELYEARAERDRLRVAVASYERSLAALRERIRRVEEAPPEAT